MIVSPGLDRRMLEFLTDRGVVGRDGEVMSWLNPAHPGYPYPEIAGYLLSLLALEGEWTLELRDRIARRLVTDMSPAGGVGRGGADYVFDSAMALAGLVAHDEAGGSLPDAECLGRLHEFIVRTLTARRGFIGEADADRDHWSASYGCHLLKTVIALTAYEARHPAAAAKPLVDRLVSELTRLYDRGRFRANARSPISYLHAHCYALEGLIVVQRRGRIGVADLVEGGAAWLAEIQDDGGGIRAWHDGRRPSGSLHTDATAQAVRIWCLVDPVGYREQIERGVAFLGAMAMASGGLRYEPGSDDANTWATIFGLQAIRWAREGGTWQWIV
jgi:hypothetical protein